MPKDVSNANLFQTKKKIIILVLFLHIFCIYLLESSAIFFSDEKVKHIVVRTKIQIETPPPIVSFPIQEINQTLAIEQTIVPIEKKPDILPERSEPEPSEEKISSPVTPKPVLQKDITLQKNDKKTAIKTKTNSKTKPLPKAKSSKIKSKKKSTAAKSTSQKPQASSYSKMQSLAQDLERSLQSMNQGSHTKKVSKEKNFKNVSNFSLPSSLSNLSTNAKIEEEGVPKEELKYLDLLVIDLKSQLHLPEYGAVKVNIQIDGFGKITKATILSSQSEKNEQYIKNTLLNLSFPWFNQYFLKNEKYELTITFKNEN